MAKPWEKYQQQERSQAQPAGPWERYQAQGSSTDPVDHMLAEQPLGLDIPSDRSGIKVSDYTKELGGGALTGVGTAVSGIGDAVRPSQLDTEPLTLPNGKTFTPLSHRVRKLLLPVTEPAADAIDSVTGTAGQWLSDKGQALSDSKSEQAKQVMEASTPDGDILKPSTWTLGDDPSIAGYGLHAANLVGQFVPQAAALYATRGKNIQTPAMMLVGGLQAGGAAADEAVERIDNTPDSELQGSSELYRELRETMDEKAAREVFLKEARNAAFSGAAPVGALGGVATQVAFGPLQKHIGGSAARRLAGSLAVDTPIEAMQEVLETTEARRATNKALGEDQHLTEGTFGDAALGAMGGAGHSVAGTALSRRRDQGGAEQESGPDAEFESTPEQSRLEGPERLGLPEPDAFVVDPDGTARRGETAPRVFNEPPMKGGAGMDQQAPTAPPRQRQAPKAMPPERPAQERAQQSWDAMNTFERNKAAQETLGYSEAEATDIAARAWDQLAPKDQQSLTQATEQQTAQQRWDAPNQRVIDRDRPVLQNRDRSTDAAIAQMQGIKTNPDYNRLSISRDFGNGAPVVEPGAVFPDSQLGHIEKTSTSAGREIETQYAAIEADQLIASNDALGNPVENYASGVEGRSRAIAGNGRVAGLQAAWQADSAQQYKQRMISDDKHGIDPKVIESMEQPVLVRIMPLDEVTNNIGDESNISGQAGLSPIEQASTDMRRIDLTELRLTKDNELSEDTVLDFIKGMPQSELGTLLNKSGRPTTAAYARAEAALFQQAYQSDALTENLVDLKGDAKFIMNALMRAAPAMAKLEGAGVYDIRPLVSQAAEVAVNARRQGVALSEYIKTDRIGGDPRVQPILDMMVESGQRTTAIGDKLINLAELSYAEANKAGQDMFGEVNKLSPEELMRTAFDGEQINEQESTRTPEPVGNEGRARPNAQHAERRPTDGRKPEDSGTVQADQPRAEQQEQAEEVAQAKPEADARWRRNYLLARKRATELGIDVSKHKKLKPIVEAIDAALAEPVSQPTQDQAAPDLELTQQTEQEIAQREAEQAEAQKQEADAKRKEEERHQADLERDDFVLAGSDSVSDQAAARGQNDMFSGDQPANAIAEEGVAAKASDEQLTVTDNQYNPTPSEAQKDAGNYKKAHVNLQGLDITIENPVGSERSGVDADGTPWAVTMKHDYGYIKRTKGADGEHVDVFIGKHTDSDKVFVIDQSDQGGKFDEHKVMLGFRGRAQAVSAYKGNYQKGWKVGPITEMSMAEFKQWLSDGDTAKPIADSKPAKPKAGTKPKTKPAEPRHEGPAIEDFGEKIGGARKDLWEGFNENLGKIADDDIASHPLSRIWPEPNYKAMIDAGESPRVVATIRALREEIPNKPRVRHRLRLWSDTVKSLRDTAKQITDGTLPVDEFLSEARKSGRTIEGFAGRVELYELVGHEKSLAKIYFAKHHYSLYRGEENVTLWVVENNNTSGTFGGWPSHIATGKTKEQAIEAFKKAYNDMPEKGAKKAKQSFDIWSERGREGYLVGKKIGRHYAEFAGPFKTTKEAREYVINSEAELADKLARYREIPAERRDTERPRVGEDHRQGQDVTPEQFSEAFGFRGVEFGNWVQQGRRQADLNQAYDALMDMAAVLDIPAKAVSLNGSLGLAFGARGKGGKNAAKAHYEPGKVVINLSKRTGAGSLGHEWWHALDNYFSRERKSRTDYMTTERDVRLASTGSNYHYADPRVRKEMIDAFGEVVKTINDTALQARSRKLDNKRTKEYWTTTEEMSARAFESYLISKLHDKNAHNDYLANIVDEATWKAAEALGFEMDGSYPYPTAGEVPAIRAGFDHFFNTIEARETESGVQLYKLNDKGEVAGIAAESIADAIASAPELRGVKVVQSFDDLPESARNTAKKDGVKSSDIDGIYSDGASYVIADNHASIEGAIKTAIHEEVGHRGIRELLGAKLEPTMERIYSSMAATAQGRKLIADLRKDYDSVIKDMPAKEQRQVIAEELIANMLENGERPTLVNRFVSKVRELLRAMVPHIAWTNLDVLALGDQSRAWLRSGKDGSDNATRYSLLGKKRKHTSESFSDLSDDQKSALNKIAPLTTRQKAAEWLSDKTDRWSLKVRQGLVDRYAALKDIDEAAHGKDILNTDITNSSWVLARMSSSASGALHAMLNSGRIYLDQKQKVLDVRDDESLGLGATLARLGTPAEIERFMGWIAGNRSASLAAEGRENLFTTNEIEALRTLDQGETESGASRSALYESVFKEFQQHRDDVLAIAEQTGIITPENRAMWRDEFYVPFYRVMEDEGGVQTGGSKGLTRQEAYKKLKGGKQNLNDLLENTMLNFNHLLSASLKNQAAVQALNNAEQVGVASKTTEANRDKKASTFVLVDGKQQWYNIDDPMVFESLTMLSDAGLNTSAIKVMSFFKRIFTNMTTITPQFIVANLLRDSMQASATSPVSKNFLKNIVAGSKDWSDNRKRARVMATGGAFSFGHIYNNDPHEMKAHLTRNMRGAQLLSGPRMIPQALAAGWASWNALANTAENVNRAQIFYQNEQERGKLAAAFEARDLVDFSSHGAWPAIRFLIRTVPFLNARLQGLDKIHRSGVKPTILTAFKKGTESDKQAMKRFNIVVGALSMASMALLLVNNDDEEYRKLEEWQKDTYWYVRVGDKAFFIPKPFEVGAISTVVERLLQQGIDDKATGELFRQRMWHLLMETFSFSPVPQLAQPALDVYSNMDAFTERPIESVGMERLSKGLRARPTTTAAAHAVSSVSRVFGDDSTIALSPVQADHLIRGYFGQVGAWTAGLVDTMWRTASNEPSPARHWHEYQPIRRFYRDLDTPNAYTRYSTLFYEGLRESSKVYADVMELQKLGRTDEARKVVNKNRDLLAIRSNLNRTQKDLSKINARMKMIRLSKRDADEKRREIDRLNVIKSRLTENAGKQLETLKANR